MTPLPRLSSIKRVHPRTVWSKEDIDFTPWLAENIDELSITLGIHLKVEGREVKLEDGSRIDILATDSGSGRSVIIENQLENSDYDHLSRMLFYAASKDAVTIIWIAREFRKEHWLTLRWLNQRTGWDTRFFGIALEVWKIENSPPAPHFRVVVAPEDWRRGSAGRVAKDEYQKFWQTLECKLKQDNQDIKSAEDHTNPWLSVDYSGGVRYSFDHDNGFYLALQLDTLLPTKPSLEWCHSAFDHLKEDRECIEKELGHLEWDRRWQGERGSRIVSHYPSNFYDLIESTDDLHVWAVEEYHLFRKVFDPKTKEISCDSPAD